MPNADEECYCHSPFGLCFYGDSSSSRRQLIHDGAQRQRTDKCCGSISVIDGNWVKCQHVAIILNCRPFMRRFLPLCARSMLRLCWPSGIMCITLPTFSRIVFNKIWHQIRGTFCSLNIAFWRVAITRNWMEFNEFVLVQKYAWSRWNEALSICVCDFVNALWLWACVRYATWSNTLMVCVCVNEAQSQEPEDSRIHSKNDDGESWIHCKCYAEFIMIFSYSGVPSWSWKKQGKRMAWNECAGCCRITCKRFA